MTSYGCYSWWRRCFLSSCLDYWCCCSCDLLSTQTSTSTSSLLLGRTNSNSVNRSKRADEEDKDDDWGIARDKDGRMTVNTDQRKKGGYYTPSKATSIETASGARGSNTALSSLVAEDEIFEEIGSQNNKRQQPQTHQPTAHHVRLANDEDDNLVLRDDEDNDTEDNSTRLSSQSLPVPVPVQVHQPPQHSPLNSATSDSSGWRVFRAHSTSHQALLDSVEDSNSSLQQQTHAIALLNAHSHTHNDNERNGP